MDRLVNSGLIRLFILYDFRYWPIHTTTDESLSQSDKTLGDRYLHEL